MPTTKITLYHENYIISRTAISFSLSLSYSTVNIYIHAVRVLLNFSL